MSDSEKDTCQKEKELAGLQEQAEEAQQKCQHIYSQIEELRNTLQHLCFNMIKCKDLCHEELLKLHGKVGQAAIDGAVGRVMAEANKMNNNSTNITVSPNIDVGDKTHHHESEHSEPKKDDVKEEPMKIIGVLKEHWMTIIIGCASAGAVLAGFVVAGYAILKWLGKLP